MKKPTLILLLAFGVSHLSIAQTIKVQPYLQNAEPNSIYILWETTEGDESTVEWGLTESLGNTTTGSSVTSVGTAKIHEVQLEGLQHFTPYYYRVKTGAAISEINKFKTPPLASDEQAFRLIAMSDMQRDGNNPGKFAEIIQEGVLNFLEKELGGALSDNLALVMIPGDLVENGLQYAQWEQHFFAPAQSLFKEVPVYPVPGNHENNSTYFFQYFNLPDNGTPGFEEHWWHTDYGNVRIIGLDSNSPYTSPEQLDWLENVLASTCTSDSIDFVFAQLHHPHKSELWLPGESDFTGEVVARLENFSTNCGKPSIHFFGHTHGYSRGQSRDHKHLWINVATAGGAIDHWGEFPQFDYDEFSVSQDQWGFVSVDVSAGDNPQLTVRRISRGNETTFRNNEITDSLTIRLKPEAVSAPSAIFPINESVRPECVLLKASAFAAGHPGAAHGQSHWQVSANCNDFSNPIADNWKNYQNIYYNEDTQAGDDLSDEKIIGLNEYSSYCWRVRYRDRELNWSDWSEPAPFTTSNSIYSDNLLINPGTESDLFQWIITEGIAEALTAGECNGINPHSGDKYFAVGGVCVDGAYGRCVQNVNVVSFADSIDTGGFQANFGGYLSNYSGSDLPEMRILFLSGNGAVLDSSKVLSTLNNTWTMFSEWVDLPTKTRIIQFELTGTRNAGSDNDSYFDDLFLRIGVESSACDEFTSSISSPRYSIPILKVAPNPWSVKTTILLPKNDYTDTSIAITNALGQKVSCPVVFEANQINIERGNLNAGTYFFTVKNKGQIVGNGRFILK